MTAIRLNDQGVDGQDWSGGQGHETSTRARERARIPAEWSTLGRRASRGDVGVGVPSSPLQAPPSPPSPPSPLALRVLAGCGVPYVAFNGAGVCVEVSDAANDLLTDGPGGQSAWQQACAIAAAALAEAARRGDPRPAVPSTIGHWWLRATVLPGGGEARVVVVLVPAANASGREPPPDRWGLTARELEVARLIADGEPTKRVAAALGISPHTARRHTERVFAKLGVRSRAQVVRLVGG